MANITYELKEELGVISENGNGWSKELNLVSWNNGVEKFDIREWAPDHEKMSKGVTLNEEEAYRVMELLAAHFDVEIVE